MPDVGRSSLGEPELFDAERAVLVRDHLEKVLTSSAFAGSKRTQDFLRLVVNHALDGDTDSLRERMIGAEMFGRPVSYDTGSDSVVRVRASEVRKKLARYYEDLRQKNPSVRIELPSGSYVPRFHFKLPQMQESAAPGNGPLDSTDFSSQVESGLGIAAKAGKTARAQAKNGRLRPRILAGVALGLLLAALAIYAGFKRRTGDANPPSGIHSIAVLPLENLSGLPAQDYFADGMTEELINDLGQVSTLRVISLTSSMSYKGTKKNLPEIAHELSVEGVVEGGVMRDGNEVRISVQLIDARNDRPIWAHTYVRDLTGVFSWQGEVAQAIADQISINVTPQEQARLARKHPTDPVAQDFYLRGILDLNADNCKSAADYFEKAIAQDTNYAQAHAALADCYGRMGESGHMAYHEAFAKQHSEAIRAIELDDSLPEGHVELANTAMTQDWDWATAATEFHRALELNSNSAPTHEKYAFYLVRTGQLPEALAEAQRGVDLDPVSWHSFHAEGFIYYFSREYDQALSLILQLRALGINPPDWSFLLGDVYTEKGRYAEAIAQFLKSGDGVDTLGHLGNAYARAGQTAEAQKTIVELEKHVHDDGVGRYEIALVYAGMGNKQEAFDWLDRAYQAHDVGLLYLKVDPCLDPLRADPRFRELEQRVGLSTK